jgi:hypothetical protein
MQKAFPVIVVYQAEGMGMHLHSVQSVSPHDALRQDGLVYAQGAI